MKKPVFLALERRNHIPGDTSEGHGDFYPVGFVSEADRDAWVARDRRDRRATTDEEISQLHRAKRIFGAVTVDVYKRVGANEYSYVRRHRELRSPKAIRDHVAWYNNRNRRNPESEGPVSGDVISRYTRKQALEDGVLVDMTEWGSDTKGFRGGFTVPVAFTNHLWSDVDKKVRLQDTRGRAHDVLWMASLAIKGGMKRGIIGKSGGRVLFDVLLQVGRKRKQRLAVDLGGGDAGEPVVTIGYPEDF